MVKELNLLLQKESVKMYNKISRTTSVGQVTRSLFWVTIFKKLTWVHTSAKTSAAWADNFLVLVFDQSTSSNTLSDSLKQL